MYICLLSHFTLLLKVVSQKTSGDDEIYVNVDHFGNILMANYRTSFGFFKMLC